MSTNPAEYNFPTHTNIVLLNRSTTKRIEILEVIVAPGKSTPAHTHHDMDQWFLVLSGSGELTIGLNPEETVSLSEGVSALIQANVEHSTACYGDAPLRYLAVGSFLQALPEGEEDWHGHAESICREQGWDPKIIAR